MKVMAPEVAADEQLQNRIILYFVNGQKISAVPEGEAKATEAERAKVIEQLSSGKITMAEVEGFLRNVAMPLQDTKESARKVFEQVAQDLRQKQILAVLLGYNATDWQNVSADDLLSLRGKPLKGQPNYRTPVGFETFREKFLMGIEDKADAEQMQAYQEAMDGLERKIYGRRFEYYQQVLLLKDGEKPAAQKTADVSEVADAEQVKAIETPKMEAAVAPAVAMVLETEKTVKKIAGEKLPELTVSVAVSPERSMEILNQAVIVGDPWRQDGNEYLLTVNGLISNNLVPAYELSVGAETLALSQPFQLSDGRGAALGFVPTSEGMKVRGYYLDPKTGLWHFAPDVIRGARGEGMSQITEGYGMASTMLPVVMQKNLTEIVKAGGFREITTVNPDYLLAGTAIAYNDMQEYREAMSRGQMRSDFYREVDQEPVVVNAQVNEKNKTLPQLISVNVELAPDFQKYLGHFLTYSLLAGQVKVDSFLSQDGHLTWMICSDEYGRTWIGGIEVNSELTSTGCRKNWAMGGDLMTPLYEYSTQSGNYGDPSDIRKGMVGMWNQYLSKIGLIEEYIAWKNRQGV